MIQTIRYADLPDMPWKNGGGTMREIARAEGRSPPHWSLSRARVTQDGAFSRFDDMVRILTVVEGAGMTLLVGSGRLEADPLRPVRFDGGVATQARLRDGPVSPFNLIFDPRFCDGRVEVLRGPLARDLPASPAREFAIHAVGGVVRVGPHPLGPGDTAVCGPSLARLELGDGAAALLVTLNARDQIDASRPDTASR